MADPKGGLPEGTDKIINGAMETNASVEYSPDELSVSPDISASQRDIVGEESAKVGGTSSSGSLTERIRAGGGKLSVQAADKARGLVGQGLERSAEALANIGRLVGETADGLEERLGEEFGDYARRAAGAIEGTANSLAAKDPDELIDDTRQFIRKSPGVALAGAAIAGFAIARLIKSGLAAADDDDDDDAKGGKRKRS